MGPVYRGQRRVCLRPLRALSGAIRPVGRRGDARAVRHLVAGNRSRAGAAAPTAVRPTDTTAAIAAFNLAESIRRFGHLAARLDPLGFTDPIGDPSLNPQSHGLTSETLARLPASIVGGPAAEGAGQRARSHRAAARDLLRRRPVTTTTTSSCRKSASGCDRPWNPASSDRRSDPINAQELLDRITQVETFERFLHRTFPGKTRFSIEGLDMMIPILDEIIRDAAAAGVKHVMIAMAHRGRLNVLAHILQKPYAQVLAEFKDPLFARSGRIDLGWMGDVKYHAGARYEVEGDGRPQSLTISMPPNPSHLEAVDPVLAGMARAAATSVSRAGSTAAADGSRARHPDSRRRGLPRSGRRRRDAEPVAARWLPGRRHDSHHRQQPARFHRDARGVVQHQLCQWPGARLQDPDRARQRRRSGGLHRSRASGMGVSAPIPARLR